MIDTTLNALPPDAADAGSTTERNPKKRESEQDSAESRKGIFVRLGPRAKSILDKAAADRTYAEVIEKLIEYYGEQDERLKADILSGRSINLLTKFEELLALSQRAQHAFENKRFYFAAMTYMAVNEKLMESYSSKELKDLCNYRLAHCWMKLAYELRLEALKTANMESYESAIEALEQALIWLGDLRDDGDPFIDFIKHYNMACCNSLKAQYKVEANLDAATDLQELLAAAENDLPEKTKYIWVRIGENWRRNIKISKSLVDQVRRHADKAQRELEMIYPSVSSDRSTEDADNEPNKTVTPSSSQRADVSLINELIWIAETAKKDTDLLFLRSDRDEYQGQFNDWVANAPKSVKPPLAAATEDLRRRELLARAQAKTARVS